MGTYQQGNPPDMRLAKVFKFTMDDLNANRSGILSWRQRGLSDWIAYQISFRLRQLPLFSRFFHHNTTPKKSPFSISSVCGRVQLRHQITDQRLIRSSLFYEYYQLVFPGHNLVFRLTKAQYQSLSQNIKYRVYYQHIDEQNHILSIERIIGNC